MDDLRCPQCGCAWKVDGEKCVVSMSLIQAAWRVLNERIDRIKALADLRQELEALDKEE